MELRERAELSDDELAAVRARLARLDAASSPGAMDPRGAGADRRAARRCAPRTWPPLLGRERLPFKRDVRKLKELGLTESLEVGYRLSPRGRAVLDRLAADPS